MLLPERAVVKIDKDIPLDRAALIGCAILTGVGAALNTAKIEPGSRVAVFGCGGIGASIIQGARIAGAREIFAVDIVDSKLEQAKGFGATTTIDSSKTNPVRSEEHTSELQSLMRISYAVFCLKKKKNIHKIILPHK